MQLSDVEARILGYIELDSRSSIASVCKALGLRDHVVRHAIHKHTQSGLLKQRAYINPYRLGYSSYAIVIACHKTTREQSAKLLEALVRKEGVVSVIELGGRFSYHIEILVRSPQDLLAFYQWLAAVAGDMISEKLVALQCSQHIYGFKFGMQASREIREVSFGLADSAIELDQLDFNILSALEQSTTATEIARRLGVPSTTIDFRLKRLVSEGAISGFVYEMTGPKLELSSFIMHIYARGIDKKLKGEFQQFAVSHPYITFFNVDIGVWDFKFGISTPSQEIARQVEEEIFSHFSSRIVSADMTPRFKTHKAAGFPFALAGVNERRAANS